MLSDGVKRDIRGITQEVPRGPRPPPDALSYPAAEMPIDKKWDALIAILELFLEPGFLFQAAFRSQADCDRHYNAAHQDDSKRKQFPCDYNSCDYKKCDYKKYTIETHLFRGQDHFQDHFRDHLRDHLRDFHKEDLLRQGVRDVTKRWDEHAPWRCMEGSCNTIAAL
ncbi:hypothetical protein GQ53DRAFT_822362 [Thozetella sp. PMI_491]|nr:hypothetical protein GQ53DRAFT_822362 [Thozetella sp. PMI_491]